MTQGKQLLFFGLQLLVAVQLQGSVIHVVPEGAAAGDGSLASPLSGLVAARARAREVLSSRPGEPLEVRLRAGTYHLTEMLVFGPEDSGTETAPVIWRAATGTEVRTSPAAIRNWEQGRTRIPRMAKKLMHVVQRHPDVLSELTEVDSQR